MKLILLLSIMLGGLLPAVVQADNGNHFGWINGNGNPHGAPGPLMGAGVTGLLIAGGTYWAIRRRLRSK